MVALLDRGKRQKEGSEGMRKKKPSKKTFLGFGEYWNEWGVGGGVLRSVIGLILYIMYTAGKAAGKAMKLYSIWKSTGFDGRFLTIQ